MRHPFTFFKPYLIIIFNVYPQIAEKRRTKSTMFANVAFCLIFQFTWYLSESAGFETEIHSRADFQLAHFTAGLDGTAFRHACLPACLLARLLACLNRWNSAGVRFRFSGKYWDYHFLWSKTCTSFWQFEFQKTAQFVAQCSLFKAYSVENPAVRSNFPTTSSKSPDEGMNQFENHSYQERWG